MAAPDDRAVRHGRHDSEPAADHTFDKGYWERHWLQASAAFGRIRRPANPYLVDEVGDLTPGTALDAGCGEGTEAIWLASAGWRVTAADISTEILARAVERASTGGAAGQVEWVRADLSVWEPARRFDLVTTHYAHPALPQLDFYDRIARWVAPGGTLLIVGHLHTHHGTEHGQHPPAEASATPASVAALFPVPQWRVVTSEEHSRRLAGHSEPLQDFVVRVARR